MTDDPLLTITDMRPLYCVKGAKKAFSVAGLDFARFLKHGARASELRGHGHDAIIDRIVEAKAQRESSNG